MKTSPIWQKSILSSHQDVFNQLVGLSSYRATLESQLMQATMSSKYLTDEEFFVKLANILNTWFTLEKSVHYQDHEQLLQLLIKQGHLHVTN